MKIPPRPSHICLLLLFITIHISAQEPPASIQAAAKFEPADGRVYHGIGQPPNGITEYHTMLGDSMIYPLVYKIYYSIPGTRGDKFAEFRDALMAQKANGRFPEVSIEFAGKVKGTDSIIANSTTYDYAIDSLASICRAYNGRLLVRPGFEFNGPWNSYHKYHYVSAFRKVVDRFRAVGAADSCAFEWCYYPTGAANDFDSVDARGPLWYPGDSYVDWFSLDCFQASDFHPDSVETRRGTITSKGKSERFIRMATAHTKPVFLSETSAAGVNISADQTDSYHDWTMWFEPFFRFISNHTNIKGYNYINWDWRPYPEWASWGDARIENSSYLSQAYRTEMRKSKYIHLHEATAPTADKPTIPITELDTAHWKGYEGGLYPQRQNTRPTAHNEAGLAIANALKPRGSDGSIDATNGKIVLLSIGMSNATQEFTAFMTMANADTLKNPRVQLVDGAQGGQTASIIRDSSANFWKVVDQRLQTAAVTAAQVQVVWLKEANASPTAPFPAHATELKNNEADIVRLLKQRFPNVQLCYISSRIYAGYASSNLNPEPFAYESAFSVKWLIEDQIQGASALRYDGASPQAPWLSWGPYLWANGTTPRTSDGLTWLATDYQSDGTHPNAAGQIKVAQQLLNFFRTDATTKPWYLKGLSSDVQQATSTQTLINPNPTNGILKIHSDETIQNIEVIDLRGERLYTLDFTNSELTNDVELNLHNLPSLSPNSLLYVVLRTSSQMITRSVIITE